MWSLFDNMSALLVAGVVTLILISIQFMGGEATVESTQRASGRTIIAQTTDWIERDLNNIGFDVPPADPALLAYNWSETAGTFTFVTLSDTSDAARADTVRYAYTVTDGVARLDRFVTRNGIESRTASAGPALRRLNVLLRTLDGSVPGPTTGTATRIDVFLVMNPPLDTEGDPVVWDQQFYPPNLVRRAN